MATSKVLQKPSIVEIKGSMVRIAHPDISKNYSSRLVSPIAISGTAMSVADNSTMASGDWLLVGSSGDQETEEVDISSAVTRGTSVTISNTLKFPHDLDCRITKLNERAVRIYGSATDGGAGTLIASVDAISAPIAHAVQIQWTKPYTEYRILSTDTAYPFYYVKFTDGKTDSDASDYIPASGWGNSVVFKMAEKALSDTNAEIDSKITSEFLVTAADECQMAITQFMYQDPSGRLVQMDWDFEKAYSESILATENEANYPLASLNLKYPLTDRGIVGVRIGDSKPLGKLNTDEYDELMCDAHLTTLTSQALAGAVSIDVASTASFSSSGSLYAGGDIVTYTGKTATSFTGIPASGAGSVTGTIASGSNVWQNVSPGLPERYTCDGGNLMFDRPISSEYAGQPIKIRYVKALDALTEISDSTDVGFVNAFPMFIAHKIETRRGNKEAAAYHRALFEKQVSSNALSQRVPSSDHKSYYVFEDPSVTYLTE